MKLHLDRVESPIGTILIATNSSALCALDFEDYEDRMHRLLLRRFGVVEFSATRDPLGISSALGAYLEGDFAVFASLDVDAGGSPFQQAVWSLLRGIVPGTTTTYGALAARLHNPSGARAVGAANALNPIAIVVPCHRVIGANDALTGYAGGLHRKRWLLAHEQRALPLPMLT